MIRAALKRTIIANFSWRRLLALFVGSGVIAIAIASMFAWINISLPITIGLWVIGLIILEWAG